MGRMQGAQDLWSGTAYHLHGGPWMADKLKNMKLWRALMRTGLAEEDRQHLPRATALFATHDAVVTGVLGALRRRRPSKTLLEVVRAGPEHGPELRRLVLDTLTEKTRAAALDWLSDVPVSEEEVWLQVDAAEHAEGLRSRDLHSLAWDLERTARKHVPRAIRRPRAVVSVESRPLPSAPTMEAWLLSLPAPWLRVVARLHLVEVRGRARKRDIACAVAGQLRVPGTLGQVLRTRMGAMERLLFAMLAEFSPMQMSKMAPQLRDSFEVFMDWHSVPPLPGGRLRAYGLVFVGSVRGRRVAACPPELRKLGQPFIEAAHAETPRPLRPV